MAGRVRRHRIRREFAPSVLLLLIAASAAPAQTTLDDAYQALREGRLDTAVELFRSGLAVNPDHPTARKDLAYALIRLGETETARDVFGEVVRLNPLDHHAALEYAFLCHETRRRAEARQVFDRVRREAQGESRATAQAAYDRVNAAFQAAIAQWTEAARERPDSDTVHEELARNAEEAGELPLAARHYEEALRLKPQKRHFLLDIGRVWEQLGDADNAAAAYVAARGSADVRVAELARERLTGLPDVPGAAEAASRYAMPAPVLAHRTVEPMAEPPALEMAERSWNRGYLADARRYYTSALESQPGNSHALLRLALIENMMGNDRAAYRMLDEARRSPDDQVAREAAQAWRNLRPQQALVRQTFWATPLYSTRWRSAFAYGQFKQEFRAGPAVVRPYVSIRFTLDSGARNVPAPLSERSVFVSGGLASRPWKGVTAWGEFGAAMGHLRGPDGRAGVYHARTFGARGDGESRGWFVALTNDANYASRFAHNVLLSSQQRYGYAAGPFQFGWLTGLGADTRREYWGNFAETGPSLRWQLPFLGAQLRVDAVHGRNLVSRGNPRGPVYTDVRVGIWYAITH